jgi:hypothetical protein
MQIKKRWYAAAPLLLGIGYLAVNPPPMFALFFDVVFDPTSYATLGHIWTEDISNGAKLLQTYNQTVKIYQNAVQTYNLATQMARRIENKDVWKMAAFAVGNELSESHYNETINFNAVMNGDVMHAAQAWHQSTLYGGDAGYLGTSLATNSRRMAEYATLQLLDQTSQRCAAILANYKSTQDANEGAEQQLAADTFDQSDVKNSMVAALNVLTGGRVHMQTQEKANGNLQACLAEQQTLQAKVQRDKLASEQIWYSEIAAARASTPVDLDPELTAGAIGNFLVP